MNSVYKGKTETKEVSVLRSYTTELVVSLRRAVLVVVVCVWWKHTGGEGLGFRAPPHTPIQSYTCPLPRPQTGFSYESKERV